MKATIGHIGINVSSAEAISFWKDLLGFLGFKIIGGKRHFDANDGRSYLCIGITTKKFQSAGFHRRRTGLNHIALWVESAELVNKFISEFLIPRKIPMLYGGAKPYPEYVKGYYAVYLEDPDRIKVEVVYEPL